MTKRISAMVPTEDREQTLTVVYLAKRNIPYFSIGNGGFRNLKEAVKLKRTGTMPGIPDLMIPVARSSYHGLFLEMKRIRGGRISDSQAFWMAKLRSEGYRVEVCAGFDQAKLFIDEYFQEKPYVGTRTRHSFEDEIPNLG